MEQENARWVDRLPLAATVRQTQEVWQDFDDRQKRYAVAATVVTLGRLGLRVAVEQMHDSGKLTRAQAILAHVVLDFADNLDGRIARAGDASTPWGQVIDPLADKIDFFIQEVARIRRGEISMGEVAVRLTRDGASTYVRHLETDLYSQGVTVESHAGATLAGKLSSAGRAATNRLSDMVPDSPIARVGQLAATAGLIGSLGINVRNYIHNRSRRV